MRLVVVGASQLAVATIRILLERGHEVVLIDESADRLDELSGELDCGFVQGDGSRPSVLEQVGPENTDCLLCLTDSDQDNMIAALVGRELEFARVVAKIEDPDFEPVCLRLGLEDTLVPSREVGRSLAAFVERKPEAETGGDDDAPGPRLSAPEDEAGTGENEAGEDEDEDA